MSQKQTRNEPQFNPGRRKALVESDHALLIREASKIAAAENAENPNGITIQEIAEMHPSLRPIQKHAVNTCQKCNQSTDLELIPYTHLYTTICICFNCTQKIWEQCKKSY
jgi:hypothetical protein